VEPQRETKRNGVTETQREMNKKGQRENGRQRE